MNSKNLNESESSSLRLRLKARWFSIQSNLEFGEEFLKKNQKNSEIHEEFKKLVQDQINYKNDVDKAMHSESINVAQKESLLKDERNNYLLKRMNEIKSDEHFKNIGLNVKVEDIIVASNLMKQIDDENINIAVIGN